VTARRAIVLPFIAWLTVLGAIVAGMLYLASCASAPLATCAPYEYRIATDRSGAEYRVLDEEDVAKLHAMIEGLAAGTCRLPPPPPRRPVDPRPVKGMQI
jgi:hypothetical protein